jgi:serine/threonine protein kinase
MLYAFSYLQGRCIVHRDAKANNFCLLRRSGSLDNNVLKICDFDTAVQLSDEMPRAAGIVGTASYTAPEVHAEKGSSLKSDAWTLGVNLFGMLIGMHPFRWSAEDSDKDVIQRLTACSEHRECDEWRRLAWEDRELVDALLVADEEHRLTAREALKSHHKWLWELEPEPLKFAAGFVEHADELLRLMSRFVSLDTMQKMLLALCAQMMPESSFIDAKLPWYDMFLALDGNDDGTLDYEELAHGLRELLGSKAPPDHVLDVLVRGLDLNKSGAVPWDAWAALAVLSMSKVASAEEPLLTVFRLLDRPSGNGSIDVDDILALLNDGTSGAGKQEASKRDKAALILRPWTPRAPPGKSSGSNVDASPSLSLEDLRTVLEAAMDVPGATSLCLGCGSDSRCCSM